MIAETNFRYEVGGTLTPIADPVADAPKGEDLGKSLDRIGFHSMETLGDENGLGLEIFASKGNDCRWMLVPCDHFTYCLIEVVGWPAYLDALARYSPIYSKPIV